MASPAEGKETTQKSTVSPTAKPAPEQAAGISDITPAADLYATGIVLYEMLVGVTPFSGAHPVVALRRHMEELPGRPEGLPGPLWDFVQTLLAKDPEQRGTSASAMAEKARSLASTLSDMAALPRLDEAPATLPSAVAVPPAPTVNRPRERDHDGPTTGSSAVTGGRRSRRLLYVSLVVIALLLIGGGAAVALSSSGSKSSNTALKVPSSTATASATASPSASDSPSPSPSPTPSLVSMPNVVGQPLSDAQSLLEGSGVTVKTVDELDENKLDGTVVKETPRAGSAIGGPVTLEVARQPVLEYLSDQTAVNGSPGSEQTINLSGKPYPHSISFQPDGCNGCNQTALAEYDLGRHFRQFRATLGLSDDSSSTASALFEIFADRREVFKTTLGLGKTQDINVDMTGVLRLEVRVTRVDTTGDFGAATACWGNARLLGVPGEVPDPTPSPS